MLKLADVVMQLFPVLHSTYRVLLGHKEREILSRLWVEENQFKQRV
uniref:Uncharacterized protein n=1 Tax=Aegilops tauschii subsp. strangulata TaxID=200361 RepID=A0A453L643_AEGTS